MAPPSSKRCSDKGMPAVSFTTLFTSAMVVVGEALVLATVVPAMDTT
eukprot:CAMPEP_0171188942 /NCGR_PEP_ID=MMETSP0790-20130122/18093_1 /TAXON_ID=2925 /ORGANISM="Alexandrium catenella, Strain OF101" /LENGTH=46 /DNA_ID= /DNA_START= /DNA_END= /DNA_ORIENTATION=